MEGVEYIGIYENIENNGGEPLKYVSAHNIAIKSKLNYNIICKRYHHRSI